MCKERTEDNKKKKGGLIMRLIDLIKKLLKMIKLLSVKKISNTDEIFKCIEKLQKDLENINDESDFENEIENIEASINKLEKYILELETDHSVLGPKKITKEPEIKQKKSRERDANNGRKSGRGR